MYVVADMKNSYLWLEKDSTAALITIVQEHALSTRSTEAGISTANKTRLLQRREMHAGTASTDRRNQMTERMCSRGKPFILNGDT